MLIIKQILKQETRLSATDLRSLQKRLLVLREKLERRRKFVSDYVDVYKFSKKKTKQFLKKATDSINAIDLIQQIEKSDL